MTNASQVFGQLIEIVESQGKSTRAYRDCTASALKQAEQQKELAAALVLVAFSAKRFVDAYHGEPVSAEEVDGFFESFRSHLDALGAVYESGSDAAKISTLNQVAISLL